MARAAIRGRVFGGELEAGVRLVVELEAGFPRALAVARRARRVGELCEALAVLVVGRVAGLARARRLALAECLGVALLALERRVLADDRVAGLALVIEADLLELAQRRRVAARAALGAEQLAVVRALVALRAVPVVERGELERV